MGSCWFNLHLPSCTYQVYLTVVMISIISSPAHCSFISLVMYGTYSHLPNYQFIPCIATYIFINARIFLRLYTGDSVKRSLSKAAVGIISMSLVLRRFYTMCNKLYANFSLGLFDYIVSSARRRLFFFVAAASSIARLGVGRRLESMNESEPPPCLYKNLSLPNIVLFPFCSP